MEKINRIYSITISEYIGNLWSNNMVGYQNKIIANYTSYSLEDAIEIAKSQIQSTCYNIIYKDLPDDLDMEDYPDDLTSEEIDSFMNNLENKDYVILVQIISGNRIRFDTSNELMEYFNTNIDNIPNNELYDFLLSLIDHITLWYNYKGDLMKTDINPQFPKFDNIIVDDIEFSEESCAKGEYTFNYRTW